MKYFTTIFAFVLMTLVAGQTLAETNNNKIENDNNPDTPRRLRAIPQGYRLKDMAKAKAAAYTPMKGNQEQPSAKNNENARNLAVDEDHRMLSARFLAVDEDHRMLSARYLAADENHRMLSARHLAVDEDHRMLSQRYLAADEDHRMLSQRY